MITEVPYVKGWIRSPIDSVARKNPEAALQEIESRFAGFMKHFPGLAWIKDAAGRYVFANEEALKAYGATREELYGKTDKEIFAPEQADQFVHNDQRVVASSSAIRVVERLEQPDGIHYSLVTKFPIPVPGSNHILIGGTAIDVTERVQAEEALRRLAAEMEARVDDRTRELVQSPEQLRALATGLTLTEQRERKRLAAELHDHLAQMLVLIRLKLGQAKQGPFDQTLEMIQQAETLLSEALAYTRELVAELSPPVLHEFGLPAALRWLGEQMKRFELTVTVRVGTPEELQLPEDLAILLFQSTRELLINTAKHAKTKEATVALTQDDGTLRITVQDQGIGFDPTLAQKSGTTANSPKFGVFSIRERMCALGGHFEIHSCSGEGTTAILSLPQSLAPTSDSTLVPARSQTPEAAGKTMHMGATCRVLIVDDHAMLRQGLRSVLDDYSDIEVVGEAANGLEVIDMVRRLNPAIVVMDRNMPHMNGIDATAKITTDWPDIIVIGLSVNVSQENLDAMRRAGAIAVLTKEAAVEQLYRTIQVALAARESRPLTEPSKAR